MMARKRAQQRWSALLSRIDKQMRLDASAWAAFVAHANARYKPKFIAAFRKPVLDPRFPKNVTGERLELDGCMRSALQWFSQRPTRQRTVWYVPHRYMHGLALHTLGSHTLDAKNQITVHHAGYIFFHVLF